MPDDDKPKKKFLTRGAGTAGGNIPSGKTLKNQKSPLRGAKAPDAKDFRGELNTNNLNSIDDFKNLEERVNEQNQHYLIGHHKNQNNQKLFDDDSDDDNAEKDNRSNLVKKLFYKDTEKSNAASTSKFNKLDDNQSTGVLPASVQRILDEKRDQLDKAMKFYNQE